MSHSKGLFSGTCPGNFRKSGRPRDGMQTWKCGRCGRLKKKKAPRCWFRHNFQNHGKPDHGYQKQKCGKCGHGNAARVTGCGRWLFNTCSFHRCSRITGTHCRKCGQSPG